MKTTSTPIRIMIVDDHLMVRRGLSTFLRTFKEFELVGEAESGEVAVQLCERLKPNIILMDMIMDGMDGAAATRLIRKQFPNIQIIALTSFKDEIHVKSALHAGAISFLLKDVSPNELAQAIHAAYNGRSIISPEVTKTLIDGGDQEPILGNDLTEREHEVLLLMVEGLNNTQIAGRLTVSPSTIKSHVSSILTKLRVGSRTEAVALALRYKIAS